MIILFAMWKIVWRRRRLRAEGGKPVVISAVQVRDDIGIQRWYLCTSREVYEQTQKYILEGELARLPDRLDMG